ncbi:hypothetical protein RUM44_014007 [Polyplax serrata]|uniref:Uncharacterized protein n=1 Tax=Polyplax serrata TaxID=468196 RepID=A0ABR1BJA6_POLSC
MENNFINSRTNRFDVSATHIRCVEKTLQDFIKRLNKQNVNTKIEGVGTACENIKQKILEHEDDTQLSVVHNICRKIHIGIELMLKVSIVFGSSVDFQIRNIVHALLNMEKLRLISKEILKNQRVAFLEEQFFSQAAQEKLWNQNDASKQKELVANNEEISYRNQQSLLKMLAHITCLSPEYELCCANNEKSEQEKSHSQNDSLHLISNKDDESGPEIKVMNKEWEEQEDEFDSDLPWCLDEFKPVKIGTGRKKKIPLIIDRKTIINNYSTRAISLNEKIKVGRVKDNNNYDNDDVDDDQEF